MAYLILTFDRAGHEHVRDATRQKHLEYLEANVDRVIAGGGLFNDEATSVVGGLLLVDVPSRESAESFVAGDPFTHAELFARIEIMRWRMSFFDFQRIYPSASPRRGGS